MESRIEVAYKQEWVSPDGSTKDRQTKLISSVDERRLKERLINDRGSVMMEMLPYIHTCSYAYGDARHTYALFNCIYDKEKSKKIYNW